MYRWPPAPMILFWERWNGPETWRHAPATAGLLVVACAATAGPAPAATPAAEAARATALLNRRASFIVSSPGTGRRPCPRGRRDARNPAPPQPVRNRRISPESSAAWHLPRRRGDHAGWGRWDRPVFVAENFAHRRGRLAARPGVSDTWAYRWARERAGRVPGRG